MEKPKNGKTKTRNKKPLWRMHKEMAIIELVCGILTIVFLIYTVKIKGNLLVVAAVGGIVYLILGEMEDRYLYRNTAFICPNCRTQFKPRFMKYHYARVGGCYLIWSSYGFRWGLILSPILELRHLRDTPYTRKLTCPACGQKSYCLETDDAVQPEQMHQDCQQSR